MEKKKIRAAKKATSKITKLSVSKNSEKDKSFPIVAIGSSAGGLDAALQFFKQLSPSTGMAFIYVQHLSPDHKSLLIQILSKVTAMKVQEIDNMEHMSPNNVYVIPNDKSIKVTDGHIKLIPRSRAGSPISIDILFSSLALTHQENVVGIVLSGNGHDGTQGLEAIKKAGGITFAQNKTAQVGSMPESAIKSGAASFILSPKNIAAKLNKIAKTDLSFYRSAQYRPAPKPSSEVFDDKDPVFKTILQILHKQVNVDFSLYKMATIKRRILHRMMQCQVDSLRVYTKLLSGKNKELSHLYKDLLINITGFFRDPATFRYLESTVLPKLIKNKTEGQNIRIWVPACSTGEEAYTIAMLMVEKLGSMLGKMSVQIFATDLSEQAILDARIGEYPESNLKVVGKNRQKRFFTKSGINYKINKQIRDMCVFATHNLLLDPPFSRIDFISCRNLLIYFDTEAQKKALATLSFALNDGGYLLLGKSETVGIKSRLFTQVNNNYKIYTRSINNEARHTPPLTRRLSETIKPIQEQKLGLKKTTKINAANLDEAIDAFFLAQFMPASVIINKSLEILKFRGDTSLFLFHQPGSASLNVLKMTRPEFIFELRNAIQEVIKTNQTVFKTGIKLNHASNATRLQIVSLEVRSLALLLDEALYLIIFRVEDVHNVETGATKSKISSTKLHGRVKNQIVELKKASAEMIAVIESQDKAYEQLQVANEEITSASEEFQTLNEELETSKEEIEATNEELLTTNQELQMRNEQLAESYNFSEAVAETMHEPMIILDTHLRIKSANKAFFEIFHIVKSGVNGTLLYELANHQWDIPSLRQLLENIIQKHTYFYEHEITHTFPEIGKKTMLINARRIVQKTQNEHLILLTFTDTTALMKKRRGDNKGLEDLIKERTKALEKSYKTAIENNSILLRTNKELETFTFISSHDLQEPLRKVKMYTAAVMANENKNLTGADKENLSKVLGSINRMQSVIDDLLLYANINDSKKLLVNTDLNALTMEVIEGFRETLIEKHAQVVCEGLGHTKVIPAQFRQLMKNLIDNALKFSHSERFPRINIKGRTTPGQLLNISELLPELEYFHICFTDNGIGFETQYQDRIFEVFQRLHGQDKYTGTGIGLAICKRIVENHQGIIVASGKLNVGAQFDIYLPAS